MEHTELADAIARHVRPGDAVHVVLGHCRWTAAARELCRQHWGGDAGLTLIMASLGSLGALFFRGGLVREVVTAYSGDSFPTYSPNPVFAEAYRSGEVAVEHWSFASYVQRLEAAARGLPAAVTGSVRGSSMAANPEYSEVDVDGRTVSVVAPLVPDVALVHGAVADHEGNIAMAPPLLEGVAGVYAARRGAIVTVEEVVDDLRPFAHLVRIPAHRVLAVVETPFGAHPGGLYLGSTGLPVDPYGEDIPFWIEARRAARDDFDDWAQRWCLDHATQESYLRALGTDRLTALRLRSDPSSWEADAAAFPVDTDRAPTPLEHAAVWCAREVVDRVTARRADAVLAGAGLANLAAWVAVAQARAAGHAVHLTAELGLWDYTPTPADPFIFNHRSFPTASMLADADLVLDTLVGGPGTSTIACVGAAQVGRDGALNSTDVPGGSFLVGSGGGNDVVTRADEVVVITSLEPDRTPEALGYVTSPGDRVSSVVTDKGVLRRVEGELRLIGIPPGDPEEMVRAAVGACGWDLQVVRDPVPLRPPSRPEVVALREFDRHGWFLGH
ncbi:MAG: glutaconate CoA-transferase [Actinobacteria bacterium]|nr:glutaconate CoA-transferase [Actinomycetota bacterium]